METSAAVLRTQTRRRKVRKGWHADPAGEAQSVAASYFYPKGESANDNQFLRCHDDPTYFPTTGIIKELQFTWLGTLQYIHIKNGNPHYFRVPRVVLVDKQYALCTAHDAARVPAGFALGNVVFGDYERDEHECGLTLEQVLNGSPCAHASLIMPIEDVIVHWEYRKYGAMHSVALLKLLTPVVSKYMVPACLPLRSYLVKEADQRTSSEIMYHVDFTSQAPRVFADESKEIFEVTLVTDDLCRAIDMRGIEIEDIINEREICTSGCGLHSGAPTIIREHTGHWTLVALSLGGSWCRDPLKVSDPSPPPHHLLVFPYLNWILRTITGQPLAPTFPINDPFGQIIPRATHYQRFASGWVGHWWMGGIHCYDRGYANIGYFRFYHEVFTLKPEFTTNLTYYIEFNAPYDVNIVCVKVGMPIQLAEPLVWELQTPFAKLRIPCRKVTYTIRFDVEAWGINLTVYPYGQRTYPGGYY